MSQHQRSPADAEGFVLAGGQSTRMGSDKALVQLGGRPLIGYALAVLRDAGLNPMIAGGRCELSQFAAVMPDPEVGAGPLAGICAVLAQVRCDRAAFVSVDTPFVPASLICGLLERARITEAAVTVASVNGFTQTFPVVLHRTALPHLEGALKGGNGGCFAAFKQAADQLGTAFSVLPVELLVQSGRVAHPKGLPGAYWFLNVNTPQDLDRAETLLSHRVI